MDHNNFSGNQSDSNTYHATPNLNTAMENPQYDVNSAMGVNIDNADMQSALSNTSNYNDVSTNIDVGYNDFNFNGMVGTSNVSSSNHQFSNESVFNSNLVENDVKDNQISDEKTLSNRSLEKQFIPNSSLGKDNVSSNYVSATSNESVTYAPVMEQNKKNRKRITLSREFKVTIFIVFVLLLFISLMPYIYDFFKGLQLIITG